MKDILIGLCVSLFILFLSWYGGVNLLERGIFQAYWLVMSVGAGFIVPWAIKN